MPSAFAQTSSPQTVSQDAWVSFCKTPLSSFKGVGPKTHTNLLNLGLSSARDVLFFLPQRYRLFSAATALSHGNTHKNAQSAQSDMQNETKDGLLFEATFSSISRRKQYTVIEMVACLGGNQPTLAFQSSTFTEKVLLYFHYKQETYLKHLLRTQTKWHVWGKPMPHNTHKKALPTFFFPQLAPFDAKRTLVIESVYRETYGLQSAAISRLVRTVLAQMPPMTSPLDALMAKGVSSAQPSLCFPSLKDSLFYVHAIAQDIKSMQSIQRAKTRIAFDKAFARQLLFEREKALLNTRCAHALENTFQTFVGCAAKQSFSLTPSQETALKDIEGDLQKNRPMRRLLQGDVGSGKTLVAFGALFCALESGKKALYLAPTTVLATQVFENFKQFCAGSGKKDTSLYLLSRNTRAKDVRSMLQQKAVIVVGTHALLSEKNSLQDVALVIIDEQQRFGVHQRLALLRAKEDAERGVQKIPHLLLMTATPIPRSLSLMVKGYVNTSYLKARVVHKRETRVLSHEKMEDVRLFVQRTLERGGRVFWLCAALSDSERLTSLQSRLAYLAPFFSKYISQLYGTQKKEEQAENLELFKAGTRPLLLCTTVVETGIDVPQASLMIVEDAQHFGLAQLHQLRGRVGRMGQNSTVIAVYKKPLSQTAKARLDFFRHNDDGFDIARADAKIRGGGLVFGVRQSGFADMMQEPSLHTPLGQIRTLRGTSATHATSHACLIDIACNTAQQFFQDKAWVNAWFPFFLDIFEPGESLQHLCAG